MAIDRIGTFLGTVVESTLGQSSGSFPQWVARLLADKKYVNSEEEMKHFGLAEPGYVDWTFEDPSIVAFMVLFTDRGPLKNYEQLCSAMGWAGDDFQDLTTFAGKRLLFRVEENTYKDKVSLQVNWIDTEDAPPERTLKSVDASKIADLNKTFLAGLKKPQAPAKPATAAKAATPAPKQPAAKAPAVAPAATPTPSTSNVAVTPAAPAAAPTAPAEAPKAKTSPPKKSKTPPVPAAATENPAPGLPIEITKDAAWEYLNLPSTRGENDEAVVADAWIAACNEVGENVDESAFTGEMWAKVRNICLKDLGIVVR